MYVDNTNCQCTALSEKKPLGLEPSKYFKQECAPFPSIASEIDFIL